LAPVRIVRPWPVNHTAWAATCRLPCAHEPRKGVPRTFSRGRRSCRYLTNDSGPELTSRETSAKGSPFVSGAPYTKQMRQSGQTRLKSMISVFRVCGRTEWPIMTASTSCCAASMGACSGALGEMTVKPARARSAAGRYDDSEENFGGFFGRSGQTCWLCHLLNEPSPAFTSWNAPHRLQVDLMRATPSASRASISSKSRSSAICQHGTPAQDLEQSHLWVIGFRGTARFIGPGAGDSAEALG